MSGIIYGFLGFVLGAGIAAAVLLRRLMAQERKVAGLEASIAARDEAAQVMEGQFKLSAQEAVKAAHESFLSLAEERMKLAQKDGAHDLDKRQLAIKEMVEPVQKHLAQMQAALEQVKGTDQALRVDLQNLGRETAKLVGALRDPAAQGRWGEFILEGVLEKSGLMKGVHYDTQVTHTNETGGRQRPDAVIYLQDGFHVIVDSKAPVNTFAQRLDETLSAEEQTSLMTNLARQVREHVKALGSKGYWEAAQSPDFTVMFLPSETLYSLALRADPDLVDFAAQRNVVIASPTLLMSLLRVVSMSWRQVELAKNAQEISERGLDLYKRLAVFAGHIEKVGRGIEGAMKGYNDAVGSLERSVMPAARKFKDLQAMAGADKKELSDLRPVESSARSISLTAEDQDAAAEEKDVA